MTTDTSTIEASVSNVLQAVLKDTTDEIFAVGLREDATKSLIEILDELADPPTVQIFTEKAVLKWVRDDFLLASTAADLKTDGKLSWRTTDEPVRSTLIVTENSVISVVPAGERTAGLPTDDTEFVESTRSKWTEEWGEAENFDLRTPPRTQVYESLAEKIGSETETDFRTMLDSLDTARGDLDEVGTTLLAAAKNEIQLYEISRWGEEVGLASKATFSREKTSLEEHGLIDTEKVPIDVGRPRLRLALGDQQLREADTEKLPSEAQELLSKNPT